MASNDKAPRDDVDEGTSRGASRTRRKKTPDEVAMDLRFHAACKAYAQAAPQHPWGGPQWLNHSRAATWEEVLTACRVETVGRLSWGYAASGRPMYCDPKANDPVVIMETYNEQIKRDQRTAFRGTNA